MRIGFGRFSGVVYRAHHPKWSCDPLSGEGAKRHGGRFNQPGCSALYLSLDPTTAWMEAQQSFPFKPQPMTLVAYQVNCLKIVDLNNQSVLKDLDSSIVELSCAWEDLATQGKTPPTWHLVDQLRALDVAGIVVRSFASGCTVQNQNLVLWDWSDSSANPTVQVIDDFGRLPKTPASWDSS